MLSEAALAGATACERICAGSYADGLESKPALESFPKPRFPLLLNTPLIPYLFPPKVFLFAYLGKLQSRKQCLTYRIVCNRVHALSRIVGYGKNRL